MERMMNHMQEKQVFDTTGQEVLHHRGFRF